ncbi:hypothetical protein LTR37_021294 [Vermiconidia calcicola]|uniref:Uncharacterized protein n=1 Tax=Vermiconidia calcicola TaxID=1690605 RepID=A0ACC3M928_9PEZI|nr:hypothetical protein LTR37_021294 [Vermiconidia calcicola]
MEDSLKRELLEAQRRTPRSLFRAWCNTFHKSIVCHDHTVFDLSREQLCHDTAEHLTSKSTVVSQFSSWASSLNVALGFSHPIGKSYISIIDTQMLGHRNVIIHVPALRRAVGVPDGAYDHEYLAHGIISGPAHKAVPLQVFLNNGLSRWTPMLEHSGEERCNGRTNRHPPITAIDMKRATRIGTKYGDDFAVPVTVAVLCARRRDACFWKCGNIRNLNSIARALSQFTVPQDWCEDLTILTNIVYTKGYGEVEQMIHLLEALLDYHHGKGARRRNTALAEGSLTEINDTESLENENANVGEHGSAREKGNDSTLSSQQDVFLKEKEAYFDELDAQYEVHWQKKFPVPATF